MKLADSVCLYLRNAALLVPAVIIKLARRRGEGGSKGEGFGIESLEREGLIGFGHSLT
jgi:hypothetical protein